MNDVHCTWARTVDVLEDWERRSSRAMLESSTALIRAEQDVRTELPFEHSAALRSLRALVERVEAEHTLFESVLRVLSQDAELASTLCNSLDPSTFELEPVVFAPSGRIVRRGRR